LAQACNSVHVMQRFKAKGFATETASGGERLRDQAIEASLADGAVGGMNKRVVANATLARSYSSDERVREKVKSSQDGRGVSFCLGGRS
jgi:hypothetical protein